MIEELVYSRFGVYYGLRYFGGDGISLSVSKFFSFCPLCLLVF